ncbi:sialin-like [Argopecten irradians]|uniref:sialin-like n=1 Tax=Argopecten irradians TaxID=31199 RepID=UPI00371EC9E8
MGSLQPESASDVHYTNTERSSNLSISSKLPDLEMSVLQNGVVLQGIPDQPNENEGGGNAASNGTYNPGFVPDDFNDISLGPKKDTGISSLSNSQDNLSKGNTNILAPPYKINPDSTASTPVMQRSRAPSKVSFSGETKVSIYKRTDSVPGGEKGFCEKITSLRWQVALMCCLIASLTITIRQCMSMAIVCMGGQTFEPLTNVSQQNDSFFSSSPVIDKYMVRWNPETQGLVLSSYYYTFPITPLIGGFLAGRFSGKYTIFIQVIVMCGASIVIPFIAFLNPIYVMIARAVVGLASGGLMPSTVQLLSKWAPRSERSRMLSIVNSGQSIGNILTFMLSGFICSIPLQNGWPFIFYIFTSLNFLSIFLWLFVVYDSPEVHPRATAREVAYILKERRSSAAKMPSPPWLRLIRSPPFWALLIAHMTHLYIFTVIGTFLPLYMEDVLKFDPTSNGLLSSLPFIGRFIGALSVGFLADKCTEKKWCSVGTTRKVLQSVGMIGSAPFLIGLSYITMERRTLAVVLLVCYWTTQSTTNAAFRVNHLDIAPVYAGVVNGITLTCASLAALVAPVITAAITVNGTREEWQIVFFICVGLGVFGAIVFCVFGSGEEQEWAKDPNLNVDIDISQIPVDSQSNASSKESSGFTLGGNRRKSNQMSMGSDSPASSMYEQKNNNDDCVDSNLEKSQLSFITDPHINGISATNKHLQQPLPIISSDNNPSSDQIEHVNISTSPVSPTVSYVSYGFEDAHEVTHPDAAILPEQNSNPAVGIEETLEAEETDDNSNARKESLESSTYNNLQSNVSNPNTEAGNSMHSKNYKNLTVVMGSNNALSETNTSSKATLEVTRL